jgi:hypothetical protein
MFGELIDAARGMTKKKRERRQNGSLLHRRSRG